MLLITFASIAQKNWEFGVHTSVWGMGYFIVSPEDDASGALDAYDGPIEFDTHGYNYGVSVRFFPSGKEGSFSVGFSYQRNYFNADLNGSYSEPIENGTVTKTGSGYVELRPHSFNLDVRWEIIPSSILHPYAGMGFGIGPQNGNIVFTTITETDKGGSITTEKVTEELTLKEAIKKIEQGRDGDYFMVGFFPIIYLSLGLRAEVFRDFYLLGELAIYNGFTARAGLAFRY